MKKITLLIALIGMNIITMAQNLRTPAPVLTDEACDILCEAAREKSRELNLDISFAIADADGTTRLFRRFGDALMLSVTLVPAKAYTSAVTKTPTGDLMHWVAEDGDLMDINTCDRRITLVPGGMPLTVGGKVVGAIAVGGGTKDQDMAIVTHVIAKFDELMKE